MRAADPTYPNVEVEVVVKPWQGRIESLVTSVVGGTAPDVVYLSPDYIPQFLEPENLLLPLDDLRDDWKEFAPVVLDSLRGLDDGSLYGAPAGVPIMMPYCNSAVLESAGVDCPKTWDDMREAAPKIKEAGYYLTEYIGGTSSSLNGSFYQYLYQAGGEILSDDMTEAAFNGPEGREALSFVKEMVDNGWVPEAPLTVAEPREQSAVGQGEVAYQLGESLINLRELLDPADLHLAEPLTNEEASVWGTVGAWSIFNTTQNPDAAKAWVRFMGDTTFLKDFLASNGYQSPRADIEAGALFPDDPQMAKGAEYVKHLRTELQHPKAREIINILIPHLQRALLEGADPQEVLDTAADEVNAIL
ncbi:ABC transporter substrate-binding protein [Microbacterium sp. JB110]|uniref:ABC transporter substrate-binding protein n=1 Tax=Microbacterium sp. JB110 TaxID=2024477 RepID=UPI000B34E21C|nr:extracellular solute-binding protein [Microbacterium sp. JB110]RCS60078.1 extracellular solute-binding protein [Microbacterium sp. JB110]